jgi:hypothetical protein
MDSWDKMEKRVKDAILASGQKKRYVIYSAYTSHEDDEDDNPIDNLDEIAVKGKVILIGRSDDFWGGDKSKEYRSEIMENPTWLQVAVAANAMIKKTKDTHHCFLETLDRIGEEGDVTLYEFGMGS